MDEPFDWSDYDFPVREKYIDEGYTPFCRWKIFGARPGNGTVDIADTTGGSNDVIVRIPRDKAEAVVAARDAFVDEVLRIMNG